MFGVSQPTPTAIAATGTLTIAQLMGRTITTSGTVAISLTLPTGTLCDAGIASGGLANDETFHWYIINTGTSVAIVTLLAGTGHTIVGGATLAIGTSGHLMTRKTAANTFVTYRAS